MKKAALAAKDYAADIFRTKAWNGFILNGLKAWYAHTRGWICSNITLTVVNYEDLVENYETGNLNNLNSNSLKKAISQLLSLNL